MDYTTRAKPLRLVLADLSKKTNVRLTCAQNIEEEPLILKLNGVALKEAMDKIADVFSGKWKKRDKGLELQRTADAEARHERAVQGRMEHLRADFQKLEQPPQAFDQDKANTMVEAYWNALNDPEKGVSYDSIGLKMPASLFRWEILRHLDLHALGALRPGWTLWFSSEPTAEELPLADMNSAIQDLMDQQVMIDKAIDLQSSGKDELMKRLLSDNLGHTPQDGRLPKVVVRVTAEAGWLNISTDIVDSEGNLVVRPPEVIARSVEPEQKAPELQETEEIEPFGPISQDIWSNLAARKQGNRLPLSAQADAATLSPTETDPLAVFVSDIVLGHADHKNLNVVFLPTDACENAALYAIGVNGLSFRLFNKGTQTDMEIAEGGQWFVGKPLDSLDAAQVRMPRTALETFVHAVTRRGWVGIDDAAELETDAPPPISKSLPTTLMGIRGQRSFVFDPLYVDSELALALWDSLSPTQRRTAADGTLHMEKSDFSSDQGRALFNWLLNVHGEIDDTAPATPPQRGELNAFHVLLPPELLGNGLPPGTYLEVTDHQERRFLIPTATGGRSGSFTPTDLAFTAFRTEQAKTDPTLTQNYNLNSIKFAAHRTLTLSAFLAGRYQESQEYEEDIPSDGPSMTLAQILDKLSPEEKSAYDKAYSDAQQQADRNKGARPHPGNPTPPP